MNSRSSIVAAVVIIAVIVGTILIVQESNKGPLEKAAEDMSGAADELG